MIDLVWITPIIVGLWVFMQTLPATCFNQLETEAIALSSQLLKYLQPPFNGGQSPCSTYGGCLTELMLRPDSRRPVAAIVSYSVSHCRCCGLSEKATFFAWYHMLFTMDDMYRSVSKKNLRGNGGLSISLADRDFQEEEVWDAYEGHTEYCCPPKHENLSAAQPQNINKHQRTAQSSLSRMFGREKNRSCPTKAAQHSLPVSIPYWSEYVADEEDGNSDKGEVYELPPHEWLQRKYSRSQISAFSVVEGAGRTLKGRDLSKVRDSVLTRTGFLE